MKTFYKICIGLLVGGICMLSCETNQETYEEFTEAGERIYIGTADTVIVQPGFNSLRFVIALNADPKVSRGVIESNDGSIEMEFNVSRTQIGMDTVNVDVDLNEGEYTFNVTLMDDKGNTSIPKEVPATVFGESYESSLLSRGILEVTATSENATIQLTDALSGMDSSLLSYESDNGTLEELEIDNETSEVIIENYATGGEISISGIYRPQNAVDDFMAKPMTSNFPEYFDLDKSLITALRMPHDAGDGCWGSNYARLTDGGTGEFWHSCEGPGFQNDVYPFTMSFDLGVKAKLAAFRLNERSDCCGSRSPAHIQIWGINDLTGAETININGEDGENGDAEDITAWQADAESKGWVLINEVTDNTNFTFESIISEDTDAYRYLKLVFLSSIDGSLPANFNEFTFKAREIQQ